MAPTPGPRRLRHALARTKWPDICSRRAARCRREIRFIRAATTGPSPASTPPTAGLWWPTTCTWAFACRTSGIGLRSSGRRQDDARQAAAHHRRLAARHPGDRRGQQRPRGLGLHQQRRRLGRRRDRRATTRPTTTRTSRPTARASSSTSTETIKVKGAPDETLEVVSTIWGPVMDHDHQKRPARHSLGGPRHRRA